MKLLLLHGPAVNTSRSKLLELRKKFHPNNVVIFEGVDDMGSILTNLQSVSLFDEERLVVIENAPEDFTNYTLNPVPFTLIFWFDHEVSEKKAVCQFVKNNQGQIHFFPETKEVSIFPFLDYLGNRDKKAFLEMDKLKRAGFDNQYLITMIFYLLRNLVATPKEAKEFVKNKNERMRKNFSAIELESLYKFVLQTDFKIKSGLLDPAQAEFLLCYRFIFFNSKSRSF